MKISLKYPKNLLNKPILSETILKTNVKVNIIQARVEDSIGEYILEIDNKDKDKFIDEIRKKGVVVEELKDKINLDKEKCIDCGACISLCPVNCLSMEDFELKVEEDKCILCGRCVKACPLNALSIKKYEV